MIINMDNHLDKIDRLCNKMFDQFQETVEYNNRICKDALDTVNKSLDKITELEQNKQREEKEKNKVSVYKTVIYSIAFVLCFSIFIIALVI